MALTALLIIAIIAGFYMAWNIGANDVANAMGTPVGSGAITLRKAVILAGIFEFLVMDDDIRKLILKDVDSNRIREMARENGMRTLMEDGVEKIKNGITTLSEILRVTQEG